VAELGAAFLCAKLTTEKEPRSDHVDYIVNWLEALKGDKKFIFSACTRTQDAVDYLGKA
jgi:antirestriction protein ArdC